MNPIMPLIVPMSSAKRDGPKSERRRVEVEKEKRVSKYGSTATENRRTIFDLSIIGALDRQDGGCTRVAQPGGYQNHEAESEAQETAHNVGPDFWRLAYERD